LDSDKVPLHPEEERRFAAAGATLHLSLARDPATLARDLAEADAVAVAGTKLPETVIRALRRCRVIARYGVGVDNIAVETATSKGIVVTNAPNFCRAEMAEHTWALILAVARHIVSFDRMTRKNASPVPAPFVPGMMHRLAGRTLGLVGFGRAGRNVAQRAQAFEMRASVYDPMVDAQTVASTGAVPVDLPTLLSTSDIVSLHCSLTAATHHLIGETQFRQMRSTAILINTARGAVVDEAALVRALTDGWIAGAGMDVYEEEPPRADHPLFALDNVVLTPHAAALSDEAAEEQRLTGCSQGLAVLAGERPLHLVNRDVRPWFGPLR
jgi:D-3-phosphoglycerate dehydrogenase